MNLSLDKSVFADSLSFKSHTIIYDWGSADLSNCQSMPIFSFFLKMVERVMYNLLYKLLTDQKILYSEQLGFQKGNTTDHIFLHSSLIKFLRLFNKINIHFGFLLICLKLLILLIICIKLLILSIIAYC